MERLLRSASVLYDANCIIYYAFRCELPRRDGPALVIESGPLTETVRSITTKLSDSGKSVCTTESVFGEVTDICVTDAVRQRLSEDGVRRTLGIQPGVRLPPELELAVVQRTCKTVRKLRGKAWFQLTNFQPTAAALGALTAFFKSVRNTPALANRLRSDKNPMPSSADLGLMRYSAESGLPVLTNDSHFTAFAPELTAQRLVSAIVALSSIRL